MSECVHAGASARRAARGVFPSLFTYLTMYSIFFERARAWGVGGQCGPRACPVSAVRGPDRSLVPCSRASPLKLYRCARLWLECPPPRHASHICDRRRLSIFSLNENNQIVTESRGLCLRGLSRSILLALRKRKRLYLVRGNRLHPEGSRASLEEEVPVIFTRIVSREHDHARRRGQLHQGSARERRWRKRRWFDSGGTRFFPHGYV